MGTASRFGRDMMWFDSTIPRYNARHAHVDEYRTFNPAVPSSRLGARTSIARQFILALVLTPRSANGRPRLSDSHDVCSNQTLGTTPAECEWQQAGFLLRYVGVQVAARAPLLCYTYGPIAKLGRQLPAKESCARSIRARASNHLRR